MKQPTTYFLIFLSAFFPSCDRPDTPHSEGWLQVGWGETSFNNLADGDELVIVKGTQGSYMFPITIRGGEFTLPIDPKDYRDEKIPILDMTMSIPGFNDGFGGYFSRLANYPIAVDVLDDGTYEFLYLPVILPGEVEPADLVGLPVHLWAELQPYDSEPLVYELDLVVGQAPQ